MTPGTFNFTILRGVTWEGLRLELLDSERQPVDLTGYTAQSQMRRSALADLELAFTVSVDAEESGVVNIAGLTDEQTEALSSGRFVWDLVLVKDGAVFGPWLTGTVTVADVVTNVE